MKEQINTDNRQNNYLGHNRCGSALVITLFTLLFLFALVFVTSLVAMTELTVSSRYSAEQIAAYASEGGLELGRKRIETNLSHVSVPVVMSQSELNSLVYDFEYGTRDGDQDISALVNYVPDFPTYFLPRLSPDKLTMMLSEEDNKNVGFGVMFDFEPDYVETPPAGDTSKRHVFHYTFGALSRGFDTRGGETDIEVQELTGRFALEIMRRPFSTYSLFCNNFDVYFGDEESYSGPVHVNARPGFLGHTTFYGEFTSAWTSYETSRRVSATTDFLAGDTWDVGEIPLPTNNYSQERVALGDIAAAGDTSALTNEYRRQRLGLTPGTSAVPTGVYVGTGNNSPTGSLVGGIYVQGTLSKMKFSIDSGTQVVEMWQGTKYYKVQYRDATPKWTKLTIQDGSNPPDPTITYSGTMDGMIYVNGKITDLRGSHGVPSIHNTSQITLTTTSDINIIDDIIYAQNPLDYPEEERESIENVLGIFAANGNINLTKNTVGDIKIHASLMATGSGKGYGTDFTGMSNHTYYHNIVGGSIMDTPRATYSGSGSPWKGFKDNYRYDTRFRNGFAPPYFPIQPKYQATIIEFTTTGWHPVTEDVA